MRFTPSRLLVLPLIASFLLAQENPVGEFDQHGDVGAPKIAGSASYDAGTQEYRLAAAGVNMWATRDEFHFAWKRLRGDFILRARREWIGPGVDPHRKLGWIVRPNLEADAPYADGAEHGGDGLTSLQFRRTKGGPTEQIVLPVKHAEVLQFERRGNSYRFSAAKFGEPFVTAELKDLELGDEVLAGLFLCSHNPDVKEQAVFRDVRIIRPVRVGFAPYRDYIGSRLERLAVHTGKLERLHWAAEPFEAPNWTRDGRTLIVNVSGRGENRGRLRRFDLGARTFAPLDTGFATRNNNDHVLSFDGAWLGISHQDPETGGRSAVYVLPASGGTPRRVTKLAPSYLHGWSPDGQWLVYTGGRPPAGGGANKFDIYKIRADGSGEEVRLTDSPGLNDGPEFTPDGQWIYFNSTRTGRMQLWRMKPDGSGQEQVTDDAYNNWFPHVSPDGKWIAFISYYTDDVKPEDHPYYRHVYLRLMPIDGGTPKIIAYVYGGQGTLNVPSWSPDSREIAFVSNSDAL